MSNNPHEHPQQELLKQQNMEEENLHSSNSQTKELIKREDIEGTPFKLISTEKGSFIALGKYRISEIYNSPSEALESLYSQQWHIIINLITLIQALDNEMKSEQQPPIVNNNEEGVG